MGSGRELISSVPGVSAESNFWYAQVFNPLVVNRDDIVQRTRCILSYDGSLLLSWLRLATSQFSQIQGRQSYLIVRKFLYVMKRSALQMFQSAEMIVLPPGCARCRYHFDSVGALVIMRLAGEVGVGAAGVIANVSHTFHPSGRRSESNS